MAARIKTLRDLAFGCPEGTTGTTNGFCSLLFENPTQKDREFIYKHACRLSCSIKKEGTNLTVSYS